MRRANKYSARKTLFGGRCYDSKAEADRAAELALLETAGEIADLQTQPRIELEPGIFWKLDFAYTERGRRVHEDVKGIVTREAALKMKIWRNHGPTLLRIVKRSSRRAGFVVTKEILGGAA